MSRRRLVASVTVLLFALSSLLAGCSPQTRTQRLARAETIRLDDAGRVIDAHDGAIAMADGRAVLIGTSYNCGFRYDDSTAPFCGFRAYTSTDLVTWHDAGPLFKADTPYWQKLCAHGAFGCYRPHEIYLRSTRRWVLWVNVPGGYRVLASRKATGPFANPSTPPLPTEIGDLHAGLYGDEGLAVDPATGDGYIAYTAIVVAGNAHDIVFQRLTRDGTRVAGPATRLGRPLVESPSLYPLGGSWWLTYSDPACPYCDGTGTSLARAPSPLGPWQVLGSLTATSCGGQPAALDLLNLGGRQQVIYQSDLWDHGNPNEAKARTYLTPMVPAGDGQLPRVTCAAADGP